MGNYTQEATDRVFDIPDEGMEQIWERIENTEDGTSSQDWRKLLHTIAEEYACSSRKALLRIMRNRMNGGDGMEKLPDEEISDWEQLLFDTAERQAEADPSVYRPAILRGMQDEERTREELTSLIPDAVRNDAAALHEEENGSEGGLRNFSPGRRHSPLGTALGSH